MLEYTGSAFRAMNMEAADDRLQHVDRGRCACRHDRARRDHLCLHGRASVGAAGDLWNDALAFWKTLPSDADARFDRELPLEAGDIAPMVSWARTPNRRCR